MVNKKHTSNKTFLKTKDDKTSEKQKGENIQEQSAKKRSNLWIFILFGLLLLYGCVFLTGVIFLAVKHLKPNLNFKWGQNEGESVEQKDGKELNIEIKKANSCKDIANKLKLFQDDWKYMPAMEEGVGFGGEYIDFSKTNVQVEGIDEEDLVKNDDEYIYYVRGQEIEIAKVYPPQNMQVISTINSESIYFNSLYIYKNRLIGMGQVKSYNDQSGKEIYDSEYSSGIEIWDVTNKLNPRLLKGWIFKGNILSSRLKNGELYVVMNDYNYWVFSEDFIDSGTEDISQNDILPQYKEYGGEERPLVACTDVWLPDKPWSNNFLEVIGLDLNTTSYELNNELFWGIGSTVYMSKNYIYIAAEYYLPVTPRHFLDWIVPSPQPQEKTIITKVWYSDGKVMYKGYGEVPGFLLNQFSMDEYKNNLRVAVTKGRWSSLLTNAVYILDENLDIIGKVTGLAKGEQIYSVRFIEDKGYVVTYRQMDPLFVLDLSNPEEPKVIGKLEIPGFSDYLHPWGDHFLLGFGMETRNIGPGISTDGLKIGLFDVSDPNKPKEIDKIVIGGSDSYSYILHDHHALLVNEKQGWFAIPVEEIGKNPDHIEYGPGEVPPPRIPMYQGLYVFAVNVEEGVTLRGKITHHNKTDMTYECVYSEECGYATRDIKRGVFIGDYIYAISDEALSAHKITDLELIKKIEWF
uniref:Beta propeller domain protein n=1 Tax=candidate division CPR3 bacterium TaxID=2268181 RepID=A0A7C5YZ41_UNCC3